MIPVLQLLILAAIAVICWKILAELRHLNPLVGRLNKPSVEEKLAAMTTVEAQKEMIRVKAIMIELMDILAKKIRNEIADALNRSVKKG